MKEDKSLNRLAILVRITYFAFFIVSMVFMLFEKDIAQVVKKGVIALYFGISFTIYNVALMRM